MLSKLPLVQSSIRDGEATAARPMEAREVAREGAKRPPGLSACSPERQHGRLGWRFGVAGAEVEIGFEGGVVGHQNFIPCFKPLKAAKLVWVVRYPAVEAGDPGTEACRLFATHKTAFSMRRSRSATMASSSDSARVAR